MLSFAETEAEINLPLETQDETSNKHLLLYPEEQYSTCQHCDVMPICFGRYQDQADPRRTKRDDSKVRSWKKCSSWHELQVGAVRVKTFALCANYRKKES